MKRLTVIAVLALGVVFLALPAQGDHCKGKHKDEPGCPGSDAEGISYEIDFNFVGEMSTTGPFEAVVECTKQYCEFSVQDLAFEFRLPGSFLDLFTEQEQQTCFGNDPMTVPAHSVAFRSGHGGSDWHGHVEFVAQTKAGEPVNYTFHFGGPCPGAECPLLPQSPGWSESFNGELLYVGLPTRGKGKRAPGCTCAWEDCPEPDDWMNLMLTEG